MPLTIEYVCQSCSKPMPKRWDSMVCRCGGNYATDSHYDKGWLNHYDQGLGAVITSPTQKARLMKKNKMIDARDCPSKNPLVQAAADKWKWRRNRGLA